MKAVVIEKPHQLSVTRIEDPTPGPGDVVVKVEACGICGTDIHVLEGDFAPRDIRSSPATNSAVRLSGLVPRCKACVLAISSRWIHRCSAAAATSASSAEGICARTGMRSGLARRTAPARSSFERRPPMPTCCRRTSLGDGLPWSSLSPARYTASTCSI